MKKKRKAKHTQAMILEACLRILRQEDLSSLTLDAVASEAGVSKGGLLYHFSSKETLIKALFEYHVGKFEKRLKEIAKSEGDTPGAWLRAYAKATFEEVANPDNASVYASLYAAEDRYGAAHQIMRQKYVHWQKMIEECGLDIAWATLIRFTIDGVWFSEVHRYAPPGKELREKIYEEIVKLTTKIDFPLENDE